MRNFIESLGTTIVITDIDAKHEHHFVQGNILILKLYIYNYISLRSLNVMNI